MKTQLRDFVKSVAGLHNDNPFHSFGHACHVLQSVAKLLARVDATTSDSNMGSENMPVLRIDPLTQFACAFSALIHDVDHYGLSNKQLARGRLEIASVYNGRSVAEQNSFDVGWGLLMERRYNVLRACICSTVAEMSRLRQLVVNLVMATDILDKDLNFARRKRWEEAFAGPFGDSSEVETLNRKTTVVIEHLLQVR